MKLTLQSLREAGAFTGAPVEREISWKQGDQEFTATTYVRPLSYASAVADIRAVNSKSSDSDLIAGRIAACICDADGNSVFTVDDIVRGPIGEDGKRTGQQLDGGLTMALLTAISEVSGLGKPQAS